MQALKTKNKVKRFDTNKKIESTEIELDLVNLGIWLTMKGELFSQRRKVRLFKWVVVTYVLLLA